MPIPDGCDQCPNNAKTPKTLLRSGVYVAIIAGVIAVLQCWDIRYGYDNTANMDNNPHTIKVGRVAEWTFSTKEADAFMMFGLGAIAMTALGIRFDNLIKFLPIGRSD
jgi:hypothetical protein